MSQGYRFNVEIDGRSVGTVTASDCWQAMAFAVAGFDREKYDRGCQLDVKIECGVMSAKTEDGRFIKMTNAR